jgi:4-amino-4-deoxy-L-arabinose transferase-like glycosyltransferase
MAEPAIPDSVVVARKGRWPSAVGMLLVVLEAALALRVLAAGVVEWYVRRGGPDRLCLFPDTNIYWELARAIRAGAPYQIVEWGDIPHFALRTPGYPLVLAGCQALFGESTLAVRLVQAVLGTCSVYLVYRLALELLTRNEGAVPAGTGVKGPEAGGRAAPSNVERPPAQSGRLPAQSGGSPTKNGCCAAVIAAALAAFNPYYVVMPAIILSEAVFEPLMLAALWGLAALWPHPLSAGNNGPSLPQGRGAAGPIRGMRAALISLGGGTATGMAVLVRPSWALFVPVALAVWVLAQVRAHRAREAARGATLWLLGAVMVMGPWWARNAHVYGRFVPTALWLGASLYDGLNPKATGASNMSFREDPDIWPLDEQDQDAELSRRAVRFVQQNPGRALALAAVKLGRFWSPWPNAEGFSIWPITIAGAAVELPLFGLLAIGAWNRRRDLRVWVIAAGPVLYFCLLHLIFASSMRYRIPAEMPALPLVAFGWTTLWTWWGRSTAPRRAPAHSCQA